MLPCSTVDAGVEGSWIGSSGGNDEASDPAGIVEGSGAEEGAAAGAGSGGSGSLSRGSRGSGSLSREYFLPWMSSAPLLLRPEGGGRLLAGLFGISASSSSGSLNFTVDLFPELALLRARPEDGGGKVHEGGRGGTAAGVGSGSSQSRSGTMPLLLDEDFADGVLRVLLLEDFDRAGCLPRGTASGIGSGPGGGS